MQLFLGRIGQKQNNDHGNKQANKDDDGFAGRQRQRMHIAEQPVQTELDNPKEEGIHKEYNDVPKAFKRFEAVVALINKA